LRCYFLNWWNCGLFRAVSHLLVMTARGLEGRKAGPFGGHKHHIVTDTLGLLAGAVVHSPGGRRAAATPG
jgi:hypothetical protein